MLTKNKRAIVHLFAAGFALAAMSCFALAQTTQNTQSTPNTQIVKIGFSAPLSGPQKSFGVDALNGFQLAIERVNQLKVVIGGKVTQFVAVIADDRADSEYGPIAAQELIRAGVPAVVGPLNSGVAMSTSGIYARANIALLTSASSVSIAEQSLPNLFRIYASDNDMANKIASYGATRLKAKRIAVIEDDSIYGRQIAERFRKAATSSGMRVVLKGNVSSRASDAAQLSMEIEKVRPDAIFFAGYLSQNMLFLRKLVQLKIPLLGGDGLCPMGGSNRSLDASWDKLLYCTQGGAWLTKMTDGAPFSGAYQQRFSSVPEGYAGTYYDGVMLIAQAMKSANSVAPENFISALSKIRYKGFASTYEFDAEHNLKDSTVTIFQFKNGSLEPVASY